MEWLREENKRLKELLKLNSTDMRPQIEPALSEPVHANVNKNKRSDKGKDASSATNGIDPTSEEHGVQEHPSNDLQGNISADATNNQPAAQHAESSLTFVVANIGESVVDSGKELLEQPVPPLLVDLPAVDPHMPMEPPHTQSLTIESLIKLSINKAEAPPGSSMYIAQEEEEIISEQHHPPADQDPQENSVLGYHSATSATSPPFEVDEALIFRAKENAARREGIQNVCPDFVHGMQQTHHVLAFIFFTLYVSVTQVNAPLVTTVR